MIDLRHYPASPGCMRQSCEVQLSDQIERLLPSRIGDLIYDLTLGGTLAFGKRLRLLPSESMRHAALNLHLTSTRRVGNRSLNFKRGAAVADQSAEHSCGPTFSSEVVVPYATGEIPEVGDYVKNQWGQLGTVTRVRFAQNEGERICIRWDDFCFLLLPNIR
jgi:hypothetical protein